jgi:hypothetical protein
MSLIAIDKVTRAQMEGPLREKALDAAEGFGLTRGEAVQQLEGYVAALSSSRKLAEELTCDLLAANAFLNLKSQRDVLKDLDRGPAGLSSRDVGDAFFIAHGAIQNLQLLAATEEIASTVRKPEDRRSVYSREMLELTARSSALVLLLSSLLRSWCSDGHIQDDWSQRIAEGLPALQRSVAKRNERRETTLLLPLQEIDGSFLDDATYEARSEVGIQQLRTLGIDFESGFEALDRLRWQWIGVLA